MKHQFKWDKQYLYWGVTAFCVIAASLVFYMALRYIPVIGSAISKIIGILSPFIWGLVITYLLFPMVKSMQKTVFDPLTSSIKKKKTAARVSRGLAILVSEIVLMIAIVAMFYLILPQLYTSIETLVVNSNTYVAQVTEWLNRVLADFPEMEEYATSVLGNINETLFDWLRNAVLPGVGNFVTNITTGVYSVFRAVYNLILGIIVSVYLLGDLETFGANCKRILYSIFNVRTAERLLAGIRFTDKTFMGFITGKLLDSLIMGVLCYIVCAIVNIPYALLVSVIVGVTNIIPFFGPLIGAIPSALIILMVDPLKCLFFVIIVVVLQQIDGNLIGPKILGSSIGIGGIWIMFSIILGAGLFGFWGMLLGVPVFTVIYAIINRLVRKKLKRNGLPEETDDYKDLDHIDEMSRSLVKKAEPPMHHSGKKNAVKDEKSEEDRKNGEET